MRGGGGEGGEGAGGRKHKMKPVGVGPAWLVPIRALGLVLVRALKVLNLVVWGQVVGDGSALD